MKCIEARAVRWPEVWKFCMSLTSYIIALSDWRQPMMHRMSAYIDTARGKDNDQKNLSKIIM